MRGDRAYLLFVHGVFHVVTCLSSGAGWNPIRAYWREPTQANRDALRTLLTPETTYWQYTTGVKDTSLVSPDGYNLDNYYMTRPGAHEVQPDLFLDYASNVEMYPKFQL